MEHTQARQAPMFVLDTLPAFVATLNANIVGVVALDNEARCAV